MRLVLGAAFCAVFLSASGAEAQIMPGKNCSYPAFRTAQGQTVDLEMTVRAGKPCRITLGGSLGAIAEARVLKKASIGSVATLGTSVTYTAKAGFAGDDQFTWAWAGQDRWGNDSVWPVQVSVKVVP